MCAAIRGCRGQQVASRFVSKIVRQAVDPFSRVAHIICHLNSREVGYGVGARRILAVFAARLRELIRIFELRFDSSSTPTALPPGSGLVSIMKFLCWRNWP